LLSPDEQALLDALGHDPQPLDMLLLRSGLALEQALAGLHGLQHRAQVALMAGGFYQRVKA
jgi:DNA processing protein